MDLKKEPKKDTIQKKPGRLSHHPLMAFIMDCKMVANYWQRSGDAYTSNNIESFLDDTFEKLGKTKIGLFRADSGFYDKKVFNYLEKKSINYIIAARMYAPIQHNIASHHNWLKMADGLEIADTNYKSPNWQDSNRMIIIRQYVRTIPKATGRTLSLFKDEGI